MQELQAGAAILVDPLPVAALLLKFERGRAAAGWWAAVHQPQPQVRGPHASGVTAFEKRQGKRRMITDALLKGVYLFADLNEEQRGEFAKIAEAMPLPASYTIFAAGDAATALYLIQDGISGRCR